MGTSEHMEEDEEVGLEPVDLEVSGERNEAAKSSEKQAPAEDDVENRSPEPKMEALEIDMGEESESPGIVLPSRSLDEDEAEQVGLLDSPSTATAKRKVDRGSCGLEKIGNVHIFLPSVYQRTGWGVYGPHWLGPPCVLAIIVVASVHFIRASLEHVGPITATMCTLWAIATSYHLINTAYRDPGLVRSPRNPQPADTSKCRWCDLCQVYQPPDGAHCAACNTCIAGFDHHCAWMGICIGRKNLKQFTKFNLTWLTFLLYAIIWVTILGRIV